MEKYIPKSALIAEIERKIKDYNTPIDRLGSNNIRLNECKDILSFLNTLEVKEVDLERAIDKWIDDAAITHEDCSITDVISTAKHFFELGIKLKGE